MTFISVIQEIINITMSTMKCNRCFVSSKSSSLGDLKFTTCPLCDNSFCQTCNIFDICIHCYRDLCPDTKGLKTGDEVVYRDPSICTLFKATVVNVTSTTKAQIKVDQDQLPWAILPHRFERGSIHNTYRRFMRKLYPEIEDPQVEGDNVERTCNFPLVHRSPSLCRRRVHLTEHCWQHATEKDKKIFKDIPWLLLKGPDITKWRTDEKGYYYLDYSDVISTQKPGMYLDHSLKENVVEEKDVERTCNFPLIYRFPALCSRRVYSTDYCWQHAKEGDLTRWRVSEKGEYYYTGDFEDEMRITDTIKKFLDEVEETRGKENKVPIIIQLFEYLGRPEGIRFMQRHDKFKERVWNKIEEMAVDIEREVPQCMNQYKVVTSRIIQSLE